MQTHKLKIEPHWLNWLLTGDKSFEIRKNDRNFQAGDVLELDNGLPGQRPIPFKVIWVLSANEFPDGIMPGYCVMSVKRLATPRDARYCNSAWCECCLAAAGDKETSASVLERTQYLKRQHAKLEDAFNRIRKLFDAD